MADMYAQLPDAYKQGDPGDRQVVSGFMALVMGVVAMFRVGKIAPKRAMDAAMGIATMEAMAKKTRQMQQLQQQQLAGPDAVVVSAAQYQALVKRLDDLEGKVAALAARPPEMPPDQEEKLKAAVSRVEALETELENTKKVNSSVFGRAFHGWWCEKMICGSSKLTNGWCGGRLAASGDVGRPAGGGPGLHREEEEEARNGMQSSYYSIICACLSSAAAIGWWSSVPSCCSHTDFIKVLLQTAEPVPLVTRSEGAEDDDDPVIDIDPGPGECIAANKLLRPCLVVLCVGVAFATCVCLSVCVPLVY
jgi:uncharacterized protein (UPF0335 family)